MDSTQIAVEATTNSFWVELVKLAVFSVFVTGIIEAFKHLVGSVFHNGRYEALMTANRIRLLTFAVALFLCASIDYGILQKVVGIGAKANDDLARWSDYTGTASLCMMGARWAFDKFSTSLAGLKAKKEQLGVS